MYALCVSGSVNTQGFVWKFFYTLYINFHSFIHISILIDCFYIALFSALKQTHCVLTACHNEGATLAQIADLAIHRSSILMVVINCDKAGGMHSCCHLCACSALTMGEQRADSTHYALTACHNEGVTLALHSAFGYPLK